MHTASFGEPGVLENDVAGHPVVASLGESRAQRDAIDDVEAPHDAAVVPGRRIQDPRQVVAARALGTGQRPHRHGPVHAAHTAGQRPERIRTEPHVGVGEDDEVVPRLPEEPVPRVRLAPDVRHQEPNRPPARELADDVLRAVGAAVREDDDLQIALVVLREHGRERATNPASLVEGGDADRERLDLGRAGSACHRTLQNRTRARRRHTPLTATAARAAQSAPPSPAATANRTRAAAVQGTKTPRKSRA